MNGFIQREARGQREHEITLVPTGSQAVPLAESDWDYHKEKDNFHEEKTAYIKDLFWDKAWSSGRIESVSMDGTWGKWERD